ncbi:MAG: mycothiol conjugate amidase Mca [Ornithinimicrobium sp.]
MEQGLRLMAIHAHPDDESSKGAATSAKYVAEGVRVRVVSCTGGERGDILNPKLAHQADIIRDVAQVRRNEMAAAAAALGVEHTWLGFVDSGLPEGDPLPPLPDGCFALEPVEVTTEALVRVIREFRPHVITTYDENGGYPHPDHVMTHTVSMAAFQAAGDAKAYPHTGPPWQPQKVYYTMFSPTRLHNLHQAMLDEGLESPFAEWIERMGERPERAIHTHVPCADYFVDRDAALLAHATQVDPDGMWFAIPMDLQRRVHPVEDFELAVSLVPADLPEDDLFAGLTAGAELDQRCASSPQRAGDGTLVSAYTAPVPEPQQEVTEAAHRTEGEDELRGSEGHAAGESSDGSATDEPHERAS